MKKDIERLIEYIDYFLESRSLEAMNEADFHQEAYPLFKRIKQLCQYVIEGDKFVNVIANGDLDSTVSNLNPLLGPLKDLQSTLRHLTWQINQVAKGDYTQEFIFLGDLSKSFNTMIEQLKAREELIKENARIQEEKANALSKLFESEMNNQIAHYESIDKMNQKVQSFRHDMKNHLFCIQTLIQDNQIEEALTYIDNLSKFVKNETPILKTGNPIFDALLSEKIKKAQSLDIKVESSIKIPADLNIQVIDWATIFGNIMDNAIEACSIIPYPEKRLIKINIKYRNHFLSAKIENTFYEKPKLKDGVFITSKEDAELHGRGLQNIKHSIEKYDGVLEIDYDDTLFSLMLLLDTSKKQERSSK
ncbi:sensor histidine kinase YesM [Breznakia sp. PF5-3]|uniref:sensor histidine kinase n=1 Tax=unclassified Breznakia TaxID=2623764 RepID=UPI002405EA33|nr:MULTISPECIES: sensor histidine kinase [unclassified Breznakia]MDF9825310.1 sensor histidine kinase YesM [Breznakia sp. PM6-1]MDF9836207.1 sensor histidine kinase YesM [Breznakia sp. PF5-3]MDF9838436.1 sensor histidine kinase YesM [Breznakia sp. PFB2-8]MDF9860452.1 sensor histidine kinase YesM [Breznakia sp. PH5-24]